jgi:hypothetical protein
MLAGRWWLVTLALCAGGCRCEEADDSASAAKTTPISDVRNLDAMPDDAIVLRNIHVTTSLTGKHGLAMRLVLAQAVDDEANAVVVESSGVVGGEFHVRATAIRTRE